VVSNAVSVAGRFGTIGCSVHCFTWKREFKLPWREAGPPNHHDDTVDSDQQVVNKGISRSHLGRPRLGAAQRVEIDALSLVA